MQSILFLLFALGCISMGSALQCYECTSLTAGACSDKFSGKDSTDVKKVNAPDGGACLKSRTKVPIVGTVVVARSATVAGGCPAGVTKCQDVAGVSTTCCCQTDLCNGVSTVRQQPLIVFITMGALAMLAYRWF